MTIRVLLADDEAGDGAAAVEAVRLHRPGVAPHNGHAEGATLAVHPLTKAAINSQISIRGPAVAGQPSGPT